MTRFAPLPLLLIVAACGYVGEPLPPALKMPVAVHDLKARQSGAKISIEFTVPDRTTENFPLQKIGEIELRAGFPPAGEFSVPSWASAARRLDVSAAATGLVRIEVPAVEWAGHEVVFGVRVANVNGRFSDWSNLVPLEVVAPLARPEDLKAEAAPEGVRLRWEAQERPGQTFRIWRRTPKDEKRAVIAQVENRQWVDTEAEHGIDYEYAVQTAVKTTGGEAESEISGSVAISLRDVFPPAAPRDLTAIAGSATVELGWQRNVEPDLAGYSVFRSKNGGEFERIAERLEAPSYSDRSVEAGAKYAYTVSAVDRLGNESPRSAPVEVEVR